MIDCKIKVICSKDIMSIKKLIFFLDFTKIKFIKTNRAHYKSLNYGRALIPTVYYKNAHKYLLKHNRLL